MKTISPNSPRQSLFLFLIVTLLLTMSLACSLTDIFAPAPTQTPTPTKTPMPSPTPTPAPEIKGTLIDTETDEPLAGARVILCLQDSPTSCCMDGDLSVKTNELGEFNIQVPGDGEYVVLYNVSGDLRPDWDGMCLDYSKSSALMPGLQEDLRSMWDSLGGGTMSMCMQVWAGKEGWSTNVYSVTQDLGFVSMWDKPLAVTVTNGVGSINLAVWNFASDGCGDKFQPIR